MNDVASRADVSLGTVSKVLNGDPSVGAELRDRVFAACTQLNYQHNRIAASLRSRQTHTIGIILPDILNTFYAALVEKLENLASAAGYIVMVVTTGEDAGRAAARIEVLKQRQVDGVIVIPPLNGSENLEKTVGSGMPCVVVDRVSAENPFPSVATDNFDAAHQGARYLLSLGHRHIALAANSPKLWNSQERIAGFEQAMLEGHGRADIRIVGMSVEEARLSIGNLFREPDRPTALFTANNLVTLGAISAQLDCGIDIPSDMSLLAFDDFEWLRLLRPAISAIQQPIDQIAVDAWRLVFQQISKRPISGQHVRAGAQLVIRQSTAAIAGGGRRVGAA
jgi:LacI family transcriptional regulator, galactose operon repressor